MRAQRRTYAVTALVDVCGDTEDDFAAAVKDLTTEGLWLDRTTVGGGYSYAAQSRRGARVRVLAPATRPRGGA